MGPDRTLEYAWRRAVNAYHRRQGFAVLREMIRENEPPIPLPLVVSFETLQWWQSLGPPPLDGLNAFNQGGQHDRSATRKRPHSGGR